MRLQAGYFGRNFPLRTGPGVCLAGASLSPVRTCVLAFGGWRRGPADLVAT
jgi:hypothetical protein